MSDVRPPTHAPPPRPTSVDDAHILCDNLVKVYKTMDLEVLALQGLDLLVGQGELLAIVGASGSGKSTLLNILGAVDTPSAGRVRVAGHDLTTLDERARTLYRRRTVGFVWQQTTRNLLPYLTAHENVEVPMAFDRTARRHRRTRAAHLLGLLGIEHRAHHRPHQLSGGEQQRAAIAVALANSPAVLLADEPTGELDTATSSDVFAALHSVNSELGTTCVVLTHDPLVSEQVARTVTIRDGRTSVESLRPASASSGDVVAQDYAVLDRAGRLQLPTEYVRALDLRRRVRLELEQDHIGVWPDQPPARAPQPQQDTEDV